MVPLELIGVRVEVPANTPMVLLREPEGRRRLLPILIGTAEATAIHTSLEGLEPPRPLTHDLMAILL
ncbi:MAG: bifunctional nuclease family protein, partial [Acidimicrobiia bacterium]|nr:bifunctional nuclease family protein [Acidimicrobiia bacterium]